MHIKLDGWQNIKTNFETFRGYILHFLSLTHFKQNSWSSWNHANDDLKKLLCIHIAAFRVKDDHIQYHIDNLNK